MLYLSKYLWFDFCSHIFSLKKQLYSNCLFAKIQLTDKVMPHN